MIQYYQTQKLSKIQKEQIFNIWNSEYPTGISYSNLSEFDNYLDGLADKVHVLMLDDDHRVVGWLTHFNRADERWFAMILDPSLQGKGYGSKLLSFAKNVNPKLSGWVVDHSDYTKADGSPYESPLSFYLKNGFELRKEDRLEIKNLSTVKIQWSIHQL